jgi:homoserine O-acetyltransferase
MTQTVEGAAAAPSTPAPAFGTGREQTTDLGPFVLGDGTRLPGLVVAWRHDGPPPGAAPQVVVVHALTGSADAAGDWWEPLIGPGRALDTRRVGVIGANLLGGRYGSTGPTAIDPRTGRAYGADFPAVSTRDQARAQWILLDALGIAEVALVVGGSLGGMVALEVALVRPDAVRHVMPIAAPAATGPMAVAWNHIQVELIERLGDDGLALARELAMTTYRSETDFDERFGRSTEPDGRPSIVNYLDYQGAKLVDRFDGDTYRILAGAMDRHDIGRCNDMVIGRRLDSLAHFLYCPAMLGHRFIRLRWYHNIHLIPERLFVAICDRYEARLLAVGDGGAEGDAEIAAGRTTYYDSDEEFEAAIRGRVRDRGGDWPSVPTAVAREWDNPDDAVYDVDTGEHLSEAERKAGWRPGGVQQLAANSQKSLLYAIMHRGGVETHKDPGKDVWVFDVTARRRVQQFVLKKEASSIQLSSDAQPLLYSIFIEGTDLDVYDAASGKLLRSVDHIGTSPTIMVTP